MPPQPARARALGSQVNLLASVARRGVSTEFLQAVDWMMAPRPEDRPQSVAALREVLEHYNRAPAALITGRWAPGIQTGKVS